MNWPMLCLRDAEFAARFRLDARRFDFVKMGGSYKGYGAYVNWWMGGVGLVTRDELTKRFHEVYFHVPGNSQ